MQLGVETGSPLVTVTVGMEVLVVGALDGAGPPWIVVDVEATGVEGDTQADKANSDAARSARARR